MPLACVLCTGIALCSGLVSPALSFLLAVLLSPAHATSALLQAPLQAATQAGAKQVLLCVAEAALGKQGPQSASCCDGPGRHLPFPHPGAEPPSPSAALGPW